MNGNDPQMAALDARLRRLASSLDAREGFETRVQARVAAAAPGRDLREQFERRRVLLRRRLRREAWANGISLAGAGVAAAALVWRFAPEIERLAGGLASTANPLVIGGATLGAVALALWPYLRTLPGLRIR